jgi:hypothetical protein
VVAVGVQTSGRPVTIGLLEGQHRTRRRNVTSDHRPQHLLPALPSRERMNVPTCQLLDHLCRAIEGIDLITSPGKPGCERSGTAADIQHPPAALGRADPAAQQDCRHDGDLHRGPLGRYPRAALRKLGQWLGS